jgi:hypothetical protein
MTTSAEVKFRLEKKLVDLAKDGGPVPVITGVHSIVMIDSTTVSAIFDISPDADGSGLHFVFEPPMGVLTREELCRFSAWLASSCSEGTVH